MLERLERQAHLWLAACDGPQVDARLGRYRELLSPAERRRHDRFRVERGRREYLAGRALARTVLSRYAEIEPGAWVLTPDARGRLEIEGPPGVPDLSFNLAHSHGLVACLVSRRVRGGVDVEHPGRAVDVERLARRYFSPDEQRAVLAGQGERRAATFFRIWTLKEAYLKARGVGISLPLRRLSFDADSGGGLGVRFEPPVDDDPAAWQLDLLETASGHLVATALEIGNAPPLELVARRAVPLADDEGPAAVRRLAASHPAGAGAG